MLLSGQSAHSRTALGRYSGYALAAGHLRGTQVSAHAARAQVQVAGEIADSSCRLREGERERDGCEKDAFRLAGCGVVGVFVADVVRTLRRYRLTCERLCFLSIAALRFAPVAAKNSPCEKMRASAPPRC